MASPREIRRRIRGVRNMSQITRAIQMVAATKMRRAQERSTASRPYSERLREFIADLSSQQMDAEELRQYPLLEDRPVNTAGMILITPDRGLTGALNGNLIRRGVRFIREDAGVPTKVIAVGKKGRDFMTRTDQDLIADFTGLGDGPSLDDIRPIAQIAIQEFLTGSVDSVHLVYPKFVNTLTQTPEVVQILPIVRPEGDEAQDVNYIFEPDAPTVLNEILPRYVEVLLYQAVLETVASFYSAQMVAMRNATDNAKELAEDLDLSLNKARQAQITNEVAEISAGANAFRVD
ncbi:MAG: ATP synthase F1 subunit gamma [Chloroflexia bacterium]|nr:ATP synthase F1 subunit gamma [Chloroflexia bacterium]